MSDPRTRLGLLFRVTVVLIGLPAAYFTSFGPTCGACAADLEQEYERLRRVSVEFEDVQSRRLQEVIAAIDLVCKLTPEQRRKMRLAGQGDIRHMLERVRKADAELHALEQLAAADDNDLPVTKELIQKAFSLQALATTSLFGDGSLFSKTLTRSLTDEQTSLFELFREADWFYRALESRTTPAGDCQIAAVRFTGKPVVDDQLKPLYQLHTLERLFLDSTSVTDAGLAYLADLPRLEQLDLAGTKVEGPGLAQLKGLANLKRLNLNGTPLAAGIEHLAELPRLRELRLAGTSIAGSETELFGRFKHLEILSLRGTAVGDGALAGIGTLAELRQLDIDSTPITDEGLKHLASLQELRMLDLRKTRVTDAGLTHLAGLKNLHYLCLFETQVTQAGVAELRRTLTKLRVDR